MAVGGRLPKGDLLPVHQELSLIHPKQAQNGLHGGGLSRAVFAHEAKDTVGGDGQIQPAEHLLVSEALAQPPNADYVAHVTHPPCPAPDREWAR